MYLKKLEIQGFKSFADPVAIDFREGVTCIVGPNGSGKSNISDALRWVLGEQSAKTLRGGKMEEIIFAGTESRRSKGMAEVTLVIDNTAGILPIDYSEVAIRRRLFRSGESEYYINGNPCRLRDIRELIMDTGIGVDGYSFIGQGRVDKVVSDKPESRREIFEEAAGIIKYKSRKAAAQRKLDATNQNLESTNVIIEDIESRIDGLREESEKAKEHQTLAARHRELEINITLKNIETTQAKNAELKAQTEEASSALEKLRGDKTSLEAELEALRSESDELEAEQTQLRDRRAHVVNETLRMRSSAMLNEEKRRGIEKDRLRLESEIASCAAKVAQEEDSVAVILDEKKANDEHLAELESCLAEKIALASETAGQLNLISDTIEAQKNEVIELTRDRSLKEQELSGNAGLMESFDHTKDRLEGELDVSKKELDETDAELAEARSRKDSHAEKLAETEKLEREALTAADAAAKKAGEYAVALEDIRLKSEQLTARKRTIEEMEANYEGFASGVRALMKADLAGIKGVVTELLDVPIGYETAIETALGAATQNIVCDSRESAKSAIEFLRREKAGRLTFLPMKDLRLKPAKDTATLMETEGFDSYALDKVGFAPEYASVFEYLLGGVVIAADLDSAIVLSKNNVDGYKIVTLAGDVINPAGALTGGAYRNKSANLFERKAEIAKLGLEIDDLEKNKLDKESALALAREEGGKLSEKAKELDSMGRELSALLASVNGEIKSLEYRRSEVESRIARRKADIENAIESKEKSSGASDNLRADIERIDERIVSLETQAAEELKKQIKAREASEAAAEEVTALRVRVGAAQSAKSGSDAAEEQAQKRKADLLSELAAKREEYEELSSVQGGDISEEDLNAKAEELEAETTELDARLTKLGESRNEIRTRIETDAAALSRLNADIDTRADTRTAMEVELGRQETRLQNYKDKLFEEFDLSYIHAMDYKKDGFVLSAAVKENREIKSRLLELGEVNPGSVREYEEVSERYSFLTEQRDDILKSMEDYQRIVTEMDTVSKRRFADTFDRVAENFDNTFKLLFGGGKGELNLEDPDDPLECGITISVRPPGKANLASIDSYSGGEKSMIAIALMFAILRAKPTPFCILDEIDAALDETNIQRFADYVMGFRETQFTLVTHQRSTMEYADALFGVTMQEQGVTTVLSLMLGDSATEAFAQKLAQDN